MSQQRKLRRVWTVLGVVCLVLAGGQLWAGESPWYVNARFGESSADAQFGSQHPKWIDDEASAVVVEAGYEVNRFLAVEGGFHDLGGLHGWGSPCRQSGEDCIQRLASFGLCVEGFECAQVMTDLDAEIAGFSLALVPSWPLGNRLSLRGKVGLMAWDGDVSAPQFRETESFSGEDLLTGIGLQFSLPTGLGILLQHEEIDLDASSTSLGLSWHF
jgi:hypothetical protein